MSAKYVVLTGRLCSKEEFWTAQSPETSEGSSWNVLRTKKATSITCKNEDLGRWGQERKGPPSCRGPSSAGPSRLTQGQAGAPR